MFCSATIQPIMADHQVERFAYQCLPFTSTGIDYLGQFYVTVRRTTEKRWGFLFTCLTTLAVDVEIVPSIDASSCVMGMGQFVSRRGIAAIICSDNGTNFVGAEKELRENIESGMLSILQWNLPKSALKVGLNPPSAPQQVGFWKRLLGSFKQKLDTILGTRLLTNNFWTFCPVEYTLH